MLSPASDRHYVLPSIERQRRRRLSPATIGGPPRRVCRRFELGSEDLALTALERPTLIRPLGDRGAAGAGALQGDLLVHSRDPSEGQRQRRDAYQGNHEFQGDNHRTRHGRGTWIL